ncbi:MAG: hypothetical protein PHP28_12260 [Actinomycetota bacterium]|nr:hypothetical protein [Actinomycetota bacterium]MDD5666273.1 hypothetical protein [Actinomycetota bacterium]
MPKIKLCSECGVPRRFVKEHAWLGNGTIVQRENPDHRMIFIENENVQQTFRGVEEIIGMPIERIITEAKRRATFDFVDHMLPGTIKAIVKLVGVRLVVNNVTALGMVMGYGDVRLDSIRRVHGKGDYVVIRCKELYSVPLFGGDILGTFNAVDGRETGVTSEQIGPDEHLITSHITPNPLELQERLQAMQYTSKPGDIEFEPCPKCGGPMALSNYKWHTDRGVIISQISGHRMIATGPGSLDAVINELEQELGDTIPRVVVEAQKRFVRAGFYSIDEARSEESLREALALRGMGNLREIDWRDNGLGFRLENPCLVPVLVGLVQGIFEMVTRRDSKVDWEINGEGDLLVEVAATV